MANTANDNHYSVANNSGGNNDDNENEWCADSRDSMAVELSSVDSVAVNDFSSLAVKGSGTGKSRERASNDFSGDSAGDKGPNSRSNELNSSQRESIREADNHSNNGQVCSYTSLQPVVSVTEKVLTSSSNEVNYSSSAPSFMALSDAQSASDWLQKASEAGKHYSKWYRNAAAP
jgi:hypothetical protein